MVIFLVSVRRVVAESVVKCEYGVQVGVPQQYNIIGGGATETVFCGPDLLLQAIVC